MFDRRNIVYTYDGSFDGLMSAVCRSFAEREIPKNISPEENIQQSLDSVYFHIDTDCFASIKLQKTIREKSSYKSMQKIFFCYLSNAEYKEMKILTYIHRCFKYRKSVNSHLNDKYVAAVLDASLFVVNEAHLLKGFIRFSELDGGIMYAEISPKNRVLPCLILHFTSRFPNAAFMINDLTHSECLVYNGRECTINDTRSLSPSLNYTDSELEHRRLWREFYNTVEIKERHNEKCRMTNMPKRYWEHLTEMN